jgi:hypothetical protein
MARADFNVRPGKVVGGILRRRPCSFLGADESPFPGASVVDNSPILAGW